MQMTIGLLAVLGVIVVMTVFFCYNRRVDNTPTYVYEEIVSWGDCVHVIHSHDKLYIYDFMCGSLEVTPKYFLAAGGVTRIHHLSDLGLEIHGRLRRKSLTQR